MSLKKILKDRALSPAFLALLFLACAAARNMYYVGRFNDDARHILAAESLLQGRYVDLASPAEPPLANQLPGYPLLLALPLYLFGAAALRWLSIAFTVGAATLAMRLFRPYGILIAALAFLHPAALAISGTVMTEPAYLFWTLACFLWIKNQPPRYFPALAIFAAFAAWIRPHGLFVSAITLAWAAGRYPARRYWGWLAAAAVIIAAPYIRNIIAAGTPAAYFGEIPRQQALAGTLLSTASALADNIKYYFIEIPSFCLLASPENIAGWPALLCAAAFWPMFIKGVRAISSNSQLERSRPHLFYAAAILLLQLFWVNQSPRYILVLLPFIYEILLAGISGAAGKFKYAALAAVLAVFAVKDGEIVYAGLSGKSAQPPAPFAAADWIKTNTPKAAILMAPYKDTARLFTGRKTYGYYYTEHPDYWYAALLSMNIKYVWNDYKTPVIQMTDIRGRGRAAAFGFIATQLRDETRFKKVFEDGNAGTAVYAVEPPAGYMNWMEQLNSARKDINSNNQASALAKLKKLKAGGAQLKRLDFMLGTTLLLAGARQEACASLKKAAAGEPGFTQARQNAGLACAGK